VRCGRASGKPGAFFVGENELFYKKCKIMLDIIIHKVYFNINEIEGRKKQGEKR
jgi:hypothetical protein